MAKSWDEIKRERGYEFRNEKVELIKNIVSSEKIDRNDDNKQELSKVNPVTYVYNNSTINNINLDIKNIEIGKEAYTNLVEALIKGISK